MSPFPSLLLVFICFFFCYKLLLHRGFNFIVTHAHHFKFPVKSALLEMESLSDDVIRTNGMNDDIHVK